MCGSHPIYIGPSRIGYRINEMARDPGEELFELHVNSGGGSMIRFAWGSPSPCLLFWHNY